MERVSKGRLFHTVGPVKEKDLSPKVFLFVAGHIKCIDIPIENFALSSEPQCCVFTSFRSKHYDGLY